MHRRALILAGAIALGAAPAWAGAGADGDTSPAAVNLTGVGLPIIIDGRVRNYVFVALKLHLGAGYSMEAVRAREPHLRDALIREAHRNPFVLADDWTRIDSDALGAGLIQAADRLIGKGAVARVEIVSQAARRRVGVRRG